MALTGVNGLIGPASASHDTQSPEFRQPSVRQFVLLKLRMTRNGLRPHRRGGARRLILLLVGAGFGLWMAVAGFAAFAAGSSSGNEEHAITAVGLTGGVLTVGWLLLPLLFFGVDETIDPARFALLPLTRRTLTMGMVAAACVGIPAVATLVTGLGLVVGGAGRGGPVAAIVAVVAAVVQLLLCVVGSRAMTSAFAAMLRSRKMRDLAVILIVVLAGSVGPLQLAVMSTVTKYGGGVFFDIGRVLSWTPLASAPASVVDVCAGRWGAASARMAMAIGFLVLLAMWWSRTLESAMIGTAHAGSSTMKAAEGGPVEELVPALLRRLPTNQFTAIVARDLRYFWRDPRWRASIASLVIASIFMPVALVAFPGRDTAAPAPMVALFVGVIMGLSLANIFGTDGLAYATQVLVGVPGRVELRARATSLSCLAVPLLCVMAVAVGVMGRSMVQIPATLGVAGAAFGGAVTLALFVAVFMPYAMPQTGNPFAVSSGGATLRSLFVLGGMIGAAALTGPVIAVYVLLPSSLTWLVLPLGLCWGGGAVAIGTYIAGDALDRRGPEIMNAITPRN